MSKNCGTLPSETKTTSPPAGGSGPTTQASDQGLADLSSQPPTEAGKKVKVLQRAQLDLSPKKKTKENCQ